MSRRPEQFPIRFRKLEGITSKDAQKPVKRSFSLTKETMNTIQEIATQNGLSDNEVLSILVERGLVIEGVILAGGEVIARDANRKEFVLADDKVEVVLRRLNRLLNEPEEDEYDE